MNKTERLKRLCGDNGILAALAIDQRGALKRMLGEEISHSQIETFKGLVSQHLTGQASSILLDPEFGWKAAAQRDSGCGLIMAYEKTGYDKTVAGRFPDLIDDVSVLRLKEQGADAVKLLLYIDVDEAAEINERKKAFVERVGSECQNENLPFFLEILTYDSNVSETKEFAKMKPKKVIGAMKLFSKPRYLVDVLKVEVPVDMNYVEGFTKEEAVYSAKDAANYFKQQSDCTNLPFIFLSAGVSPQLFQDTLVFAKQSGSTFNGVLCGRATWAGAAQEFKVGGENAAKQWLNTHGLKNIQALNSVLAECATAIQFAN